MYAIYIIAVCMMIMSMVVISSGEDPEQENLASVQVEQMLMYHKSAVKACQAVPASCAGAVEIPRASIRAQISGVAANGAAYNSNSLYRAFSDGSGHVVTTMVPAIAYPGQVGTAAYNAALPGVRQRFATHGMFLEQAQNKYTYLYAGLYDRNSSRLPNTHDDTLVVPRSISSANAAFMPSAPMFASEW